MSCRPRVLILPLYIQREERIDYTSYQHQFNHLRIKSKWIAIPIHAAATQGDNLSPILDNLQKKKRMSLVPSIHDEICCVSGETFNVAARINEQRQIQSNNTVIRDAKSKTADIFFYITIKC